MKRKMNGLKLIAIMILTLGLTGCCKEPVPPVPVPPSVESGSSSKKSIVIGNYGTFVIRNLATDELIEGNTTTAVFYDSLEIAFKANTNDKFQIIAEMNDEILSDVKYLKAKSGSLKLKAQNIKVQTNGDTLVYQTERVLTINCPSKYSDVQYYISISPDLQTFVSPELIFTDESGKEHVYEPFATGDVKRDSIDFDLGEGDIERVEAYNSWKKTVRYFKWGHDYEAKLTFKRRPNVNYDKESYNLGSGFGPRGGSSIGSDAGLKTFTWMTIDLSIIIGVGGAGFDEDGNVKKENLEEFLDKLVSTPVVIKMRISDDGYIEKM